MDKETHTWEFCQPERMASQVICGEIDATETNTVSKLGQLQKDKFILGVSHLGGFWILRSSKSVQWNKDDKQFREKDRIGKSQKAGAMLNTLYIPT